MPSATLFLLGGLLVAVVTSSIAWLRHRPSRSPSRSAEEFRSAMRALSPSRDRR